MTLQTTISMGQLVIAAMAASMIGTTADAAPMTLASAGPGLEIGPAEQAKPADAPQRPEAGQRGGGPLRRGSRPEDDAQFTAEQTDKQTRVLALGSDGVLELRTFVGDVSIISGSGREVRLEIVRRSRGRTDADAKLGLEQVTAAIDHQGERASVIVRLPSSRRTPHRVSVSYNVIAPAGTRVSAASVVGTVTIRNITGDLDAHVTSGNIAISGARRVTSAKSISGDVTLTDINSDEGINVGTMAGDVILDRVKARRVEVEVTDGNIRASDIETRTAEIGSLGGSVDFSGRLVDGGRYQLRAHSGDLRIKVLGKTGFELLADSFSGQIRPAPGLGLQSVSRVRNSLRGTVGDGDAQMVARTFSGNIEISR
jgi:hypothetical protein